MTKNAISIHNLSYFYKSNWSWRKKAALKPFSLDVLAGESFGFLGHNGAGKTTTIKCILDLIRPAHGTISLFGISNRDPHSRTHVGYIPEQPYFYDNLTVVEILTMYARLCNLSGKRLSARVHECLELVGLKEKSNQVMRALSKGLTQRVALAQAIIASPKLLILDEPFSGLDPVGRKEFRDIFQTLKSGGTTLFISSHILSDVEYLCDRVSIMVGGSLQGVYVVKEIPQLTDARVELIIRGYKNHTDTFTNHAQKFTEQGDRLLVEYSSRAHAEEMLKFALSNELAVDSYTFSQGSLEDLFIKLVKENR